MQNLINVDTAGLGIVATIETKDVPKDTHVAITGDAQVDVAGSGDIVIGHVSRAAKAGEEDAECTIETRYKRLFTAKAVGGALAAGALVKAGAPASGNVSTVATTDGSDWELVVGIVWIGAAENAEVTVLGY